MRYVVTGAARFIGSHLGESLRGTGHEVVGFDSFTDYYDFAMCEALGAAGEIVGRPCAFARAADRPAT